MAGQIIDRGNGKYLVRVYIGQDENGKRNYHSKTITGGIKKAEQYRNKILREKDTETFTEPSRELLSVYMDKWLDSAVKNRVREKTYLDYSDRVRLYIKPVLGSTMLHKIRPEQIQKLYNDMQDRGLSPRTVRYAHTILKNALDQAVKWGKIYRNPAELVDLPRQKKKEMKCLTPEQAAIFMDATIYSPYKALFSLLLTSGMRPSEALALKWPDIDFKNRRVTVRRSLSRVNGKGLVLEETKTDRSRRTIPLPSNVIADLQELKKEYDRAAAERNAKEKWNLPVDEYNDQGLVFANTTGGPLDEGNILRRHFKPLLKSAGLPDIRLYDLRHSCATLLLSAGENPKIVSERLGHSSINLTLDTYSHVLPDMQVSATDKLEKMLYDGK